jgi:hypothetical protein
MSGNFNTTQYENPNTLSKTEEETLNQKLNTIRIIKNIDYDSLLRSIR